MVSFSELFQIINKETPIETSPKYLSFMERYLKATPVKISFSKLFLRAQRERVVCALFLRTSLHIPNLGELRMNDQEVGRRELF